MQDIRRSDASEGGTKLVGHGQGPAFSPALVIGINSTAGAGATVLWSAIFVCHLGLLMFLQRRYCRWFKYPVPAHLFIVSGIAIAKHIWWYQFSAGQ